MSLSEMAGKATGGELRLVLGSIHVRYRKSDVVTADNIHIYTEIDYRVCAHESVCVCVEATSRLLVVSNCLVRINNSTPFGFCFVLLQLLQLLF